MNSCRWMERWGKEMHLITTCIHTGISKQYPLYNSLAQKFLNIGFPQSKFKVPIMQN